MQMNWIPLSVTSLEFSTSRLLKTFILSGLKSKNHLKSISRSLCQYLQDIVCTISPQREVSEMSHSHKCSTVVS